MAGQSPEVYMRILMNPLITLSNGAGGIEHNLACTAVVGGITVQYCSGRNAVGG